MNTHPTLATRFARHTATIRSDSPLEEAQMRTIAPSIFAPGKHESRSARYTYIPTIDILRSLRTEGFEPFMVAQGICRKPGKTEYTKHMVRLRHATQVEQRDDANEIILINSHDGASSYQMLAGVFRFVCCNGLVFGDVSNDIRIPHKGNIQDDVIEGAFRVLDDFERVDESASEMKALTLSEGQERAFATAAVSLRFGGGGDAQPAAPVTPLQLLESRRPQDEGRSLWSTFQRVQENAMRGGLHGRTAQGRRTTTRPICSIDRSIDLNRALWILADEMRKLAH